MTESNQPTEVESPPAPGPTPITATTSFEDQERAVGIDPDAPLPGEGGLRIILFGAIALFGIPAVLGGGIAAGYPIVGIVLAVALGAVCLLFARPRQRA
ncbi:MAG TPA: hypothetical protein VIZ22_05790 [Candidatus Limnocylindrales bacterium]